MMRSFFFFTILCTCGISDIHMSCLTLCDSMNCSPPGSSVHGILQAGILEWVAIPFSRGSSRPRDRAQVSCIGRWILHRLSHQGSLRPRCCRSFAEAISECWGDVWVAIRSLSPRASLVAQTLKNLPASAGDTGDVGLIPGSGRSSGEGNGNPLQYS